MKKDNYHISIIAEADEKTAFDTICNVAGWWTSKMEGSCNKLNDVFTVRLGETSVTFKVTEYEPFTKVSWRVTDCNLHWLKDTKEWKDTTVAWQVDADNGQTKITMTHIGLVPGIECYDNCKNGWNFYTGESLRKLINEGHGLPEAPKSLR